MYFSYSFIKILFRNVTVVVVVNDHKFGIDFYIRAPTSLLLVTTATHLLEVGGVHAEVGAELAEVGPGPGPVVTAQRCEQSGSRPPALAVIGHHCARALSEIIHWSLRHRHQDLLLLLR